MVFKDENKQIVSSSGYSNAKVVLLGDSGVGKSGLSLALTKQPFVPTEATHSLNIWTFDSQTVELKSGSKEIRETLLWDVAGHSEYRLIDQLHLNDVSVALVAIDPASAYDILTSIRAWNRVLSILQDIQHKGRLPLKKFLVLTRMDRSSSVSISRIEALVRELGFDDYFETSAKEGRGINELAGAIRGAIDWERIPAVSSTKFFDQVKTFLLTAKGMECPLSTADALYESFLKSASTIVATRELRIEFVTCIQQVEHQGIIQRLAFNDLVLLRPKLLDIYMLELLNTVKDEPDGLGSILEERVRTAHFFIPGNERLKDRTQERLLIAALVEELMLREIVLREQCDDGTYLVFPSLLRRDRPNLSEPVVKTLTFTFDGPALNIYLTLLVRLTHSNLFRRPKMWNNAVIYTARTKGTCGIFLENINEQEGKLSLFFHNTSEETRLHFEEYVQRHLQNKALPGSIQRRRIFVCSTCGFVVTDQLVQVRQERGFDWLTCPICETSISLLDQLEPDIPQDQHSKPFDVFLCYNSRDKAEVREIARQLKARGVVPWLDEWELRPGLPWKFALEEQIEQIKSAAVFVGKDGIGPWQNMELDAFLREFISRSSPVIPVLLADAPANPKLPAYLSSMTWVDFRKQDPDPMLRLIWGITGKSSRIPEVPEISQRTSGSPLSQMQEAEALWDINELRLIIGDRSFRNYRHLARNIMRRIGIEQFQMIDSPNFGYGIAWEITLPKIGLQFDTQKAILLLRQKEEEAKCYRELLERAQGNTFIIIMDIADVPLSPFQLGPRTVWFSPDSLVEMIQTSPDQIPSWLSRFIVTQVGVSVKRALLPYVTKGATKLFFGRDDELMDLTRPDHHGGIIAGAHSSGKSSLLEHLKNKLEQKQSNIKAIGPYELGGIGFQTFFEETLEPLDIAVPADMTPESWSSALKKYRKMGVVPIFLLDEVDDLLDLDRRTQFKLGKRIRALNNAGDCEFYLAGHAKLREATLIPFGPFQNFANEIILTGLTENASKHLIQIPMKNVGFDVSDKQAKKIFKGTAGVPFLIQDFCLRLVCGLSPSQASRPTIEDSVIEETEQSPEYLETVLHYYGYDQTPTSHSVMFVTALLGRAARQDILKELSKRSFSLERPQLDASLQFLTAFGVLKAVGPDLFTVCPNYLTQAIMRRDPEPLLNSFIEKAKRGIDNESD